MDVLDPTGRTACWVFVGGEWWPGEVMAWDNSSGAWRAQACVTVDEMRFVKRVGLVLIQQRRLRWLDASHVLKRANDERRPTHPG